MSGSGNLERLIKSGATVEQLASVVPVELTAGEIERHQIYSNLLRAMTVWAWNGNKYGAGNAYPLNPSPRDKGNLERSPSLLGSYLGHNIAAIAVDALGRVVDFQFNHNELFQSSVEHAESRLLRRVFSLRQVNDAWDLDGARNPNHKYGELFGEVTVYTTLESCSQCSGMMTLAGVKRVVYLQPDPGMYRIGYILRELTKRDDGKTYLQAPQPISPWDIRLSGVDQLVSRFRAFVQHQKDKEGSPFCIQLDKSKKWTGSVTSFLCTADAYQFFLLGWDELKALQTVYSDGGGSPSWSPDGVPNALSNEEALREAMDFYLYVRQKGSRGTPHRA